MLFSDLNKAQTQAVTSDAQAAAIIAGPGSGKTKTLIAKILYALEKGIAAEQILAVTFTNKAKKEIAERIKAITEESVSIHTFHSLALNILQSQNLAAEIIDNSNHRRIITLLKSSKSTPLKFRSLSISELSLLISNLKTSARKLDQDEELLINTYDSLLAKAGVLDFDDLILTAASQFRGMNGFYRLVLVDEFQDTNPLQYEFLKLISKGAKLFIIGDPKQSIYGFRGADKRVFDKFEEDFNPEVIQLNYNYRSSPQIVNFANSIFPKYKQKAAVKHQGGVKWTKFLNEYSEAQFIVDEISKLVGGTNLIASSNYHEPDSMDFSDFAVIYRTHSQAQVLAKKLFESGIPHSIKGEISIYEQPLIEFFTNLLRTRLQNSSKAAINILEVLFKHNLTSHITKISKNQKIAIFEALQFAINQKHINKQQIQAASKFLKNLEKIDFTKRVNELLEDVIEIFELDTKFKTASRLTLEFASQVTHFTGDIPGLEFLNYIDNLDDDYHDENSNRVSILSVHAAKGLEYKNVFVIGLNQGFFPITKFDDSKAHLEEEERLFYVAVTRAKQNLYLTSTKERARHQQEPSIFLKKYKQALSEINEDANMQKQLKKRLIRNELQKQTSLF